jgi:membrane protease YdiL (CAAX protease family)
VCVVDPPVPSRLLFWTFVGSTVGTFAGTALLARVLGIPLERAFSTRGQWHGVVVEFVLGVLWVVLLRRHGWSLSCITMPPKARDLLRAVALVATCSVAYGLAMFAWVKGLPGARYPAAVMVSSRISWWAICAVSIVNPMAEEFVYLGFVTNVLRRRGEFSAIVPAVAARMAIHVYQGPVRVVGMAAIGAVLSVYYYRTRRLWPVVVAHGLLDFLALTRMNAGVG